MKLTKILAAAAVVAIGATAQAEDQTSATYCVITLPVVAGYNLYGVAVNPGDATYAEMLGVAVNTRFIKTSDGDTFDADSAAVAKTAFWYKSGESGSINSGDSGLIYQFGVDASSGTDDYTAVKGAVTPMAFKKRLTLADFTETLSVNSYKLNNAKANAVSVWDAANQVYVKYYYKDKVGWRRPGSNDAVNASSVEIPAGSAVFVQISSLAPANVTFTF